VNLVEVYNVPKVRLRRFVGTVPPDKMRQVCQALSRAVGCDS
jgi:mRNA-degrading endonuclease toxin of MazEF toxin-antitoxin module